MHPRELLGKLRAQDPDIPVIVGGMAGGIGASVREQSNRPVIGLAMAEDDAARMIAAQKSLSRRLASRCARPRSRVQTPAASANGESLAIATASSSLAHAVGRTIRRFDDDRQARARTTVLLTRTLDGTTACGR